MTKGFATVLAFVRISSFGHSFVIRHSTLTGDISRPNEPFDQPVAGALRAGFCAHGTGDPDAAAKERRLGSGIWRWGYGKYLRRADDQCPGEVHYVAGRHFFRADVWLVRP